jgi:hypothetical protein
MQLQNSTIKQSWKYLIEARVGAPGYADDDQYESDEFIDFYKMFDSYLNFNPEKHFRHLRSVQDVYLIYNNNGDTSKYEWDSIFKKLNDINNFSIDDIINIINKLKNK